MMPSRAASRFYLAVFALFTASCAAAEALTPTQSSSNPDICTFNPKAKVSDACASYSDLDALNNRLQPFVRNLANNTDFFSYYRLNLFNKECPFWNDENGMCGNIACAVATVDNEEDLPIIWRAAELSKLEGPKAQHPGREQQKARIKPLLGELGDNVGESCVVEYDDECDDRDYCVPEDESATGKGDYVSLADNPERFTGYGGEGAHHVWAAIYNENCFSPQTAAVSKPNKRDSSGAASPFMNQAQAKKDFRQVVKAHDKKLANAHGQGTEDLHELDECLEKRVFYRVVSGMHASISTHLCHDYLNQTTGQWTPNLQCYKERLYEHPERISNLYFNYALVLRAVGKLKDYIQDYTFCTGDPMQDKQTKQLVSRLAKVIPSGPQIFDERVMFQDQTASGIVLKEDFRNRFRNVSRIMDCVGCDKCRLWGKIQTAGYGTALKVLFEFDEANTGEDKLLLRRHELVALINTLDKISGAIKALHEFQGLMAAENNSIRSQHPTDLKKTSEKAKESLSDLPSDFRELDDLEEPSHECPRSEQSVSEAFWTELDLVTRALAWVLKSWVRIPGLMVLIVKSEIGRVMDFWLGRVVRDRAWEFHFPTRDEL